MRLLIVIVAALVVGVWAAALGVINGRPVHAQANALLLTGPGEHSTVAQTVDGDAAAALPQGFLAGPAERNDSASSAQGIRPPAERWVQPFQISFNGPLPLDSGVVALPYIDWDGQANQAMREQYRTWRLIYSCSIPVDWANDSFYGVEAAAEQGQGIQPQTDRNWIPRPAVNLPNSGWKVPQGDRPQAQEIQPGSNQPEPAAEIPVNDLTEDQQLANNPQAPASLDSEWWLAEPINVLEPEWWTWQVVSGLDPIEPQAELVEPDADSAPASDDSIDLSDSIDADAPAQATEPAGQEPSPQINQQREQQLDLDQPDSKPVQENVPMEAQWAPWHC